MKLKQATIFVIIGVILIMFSNLFFTLSSFGLFQELNISNSIFRITNIFTFIYVVSLLNFFITLYKNQK